MNLKDAAVPAAVLRVLEERVKQARKERTAEVLAAGDPQDRVNAVHDGRKLGSVSISEGRTSARVADQDAFAAWCAEHYPTEVEHRPVVRAAFANAVVDASKQAGEPCMPDGTLDVPGVEVRTGDPYVTVRLTHAAADIVTDMVRTGAISLDGTMRELDGGAS